MPVPIASCKMPPHVDVNPSKRTPLFLGGVESRLPYCAVPVHVLRRGRQANYHLLKVGLVLKIIVEVGCPWKLVEMFVGRGASRRCGRGLSVHFTRQSMLEAAIKSWTSRGLFSAL